MISNDYKCQWTTNLLVLVTFVFVFLFFCVCLFCLFIFEYFNQQWNRSIAKEVKYNFGYVFIIHPSPWSRPMKACINCKEVLPISLSLAYNKLVFGFIGQQFCSHLDVVCGGIFSSSPASCHIWNMDLVLNQSQISSYTIFLIIFGAHMNNLFHCQSEDTFVTVRSFWSLYNV